MQTIMSNNKRSIARLRWLVLLLAVAVLAVLLFGCANMSTNLHNPETGQDYNCHATGWGWLGAPAAIVMHSRCVAEMESRGYEVAK